MTVFKYSGHGRTRASAKPTAIAVDYQPAGFGFPNRPVIDFSANNGGAGGAVVTVADADIFSFTDNVWPAGWQPGDPEPDRASDKPFSVSAWIQVEDDAPSHGVIIAKYNSNQAAEWLLYTRAGNNPGPGEGAGLYWMMFSDGANYGGSTAHPNHPNPNPGANALGQVSTAARIRLRTPNTEILENDEWYHIVATYDGSASHEGLNCYVNGVELRDIPEAQAQADSNNYVGMLQTDRPLTIGNGGGLGFERAITDAAVFDVELTAEDAVELYNEGMVLDLTEFSKYSNAIAWWPLGPGDAAPDAFERIAGRTGVISNTAVVDTTTSNTSTGPFSLQGFDTEGQRYLNLSVYSDFGGISDPQLEVWGQAAFAGRNRWFRLTMLESKPSFATPNPARTTTLTADVDRTTRFRVEVDGIDKVFFSWLVGGANLNINATVSTY